MVLSTNDTRKIIHPYVKKKKKKNRKGKEKNLSLPPYLIAYSKLKMDC